MVWKNKQMTAFLVPYGGRVGLRRLTNRSHQLVRVAACAEKPSDGSPTRASISKVNPSSSDPSPPAPSRPRKRQVPSEYSMRTRLREETEAPFRKVRQFVFVGSALSAAVGSFVAATRIVAALAGVRGVQPLSETSTNLAVNLAVIGGCAFLWKLEQNSGNRRLERMSRGARVAKLKVNDFASGKVLRMAELRFQYRTVIVAGPFEKVASSLKDAQEFGDRISELNIKIVPLVTHANVANYSSIYSSETGVDRANWIADPYDETTWRTWLLSEIKLSSKSKSMSNDSVYVIIVRLDGKIGARSIGAPLWARLVNEVSTLPKSDRYGKP